MKNLLIVFVLLVVSVSNAQEKSAYEKDTYMLVEMLSKPAFGSVIDQFTAYVNEDNVETFKKEVEATLPTLYASLTEIYLEEYSHEEVKELLKFYNTDLGKKVASNSAKLAMKGQVVGEKWGMKLQDIMAKHQ